MSISVNLADRGAKKKYHNFHSNQNRRQLKMSITNQNSIPTRLKYKFIQTHNYIKAEQILGNPTSNFMAKQHIKN